MVRAILAFLVLALVLPGMAAGPVGAEMAKQGSFSGIDFFTGQTQVLASGTGHVRMNYEVFGLTHTDNKDNPFYNATFHCLGSLDSIKRAYDNDAGFCIYTRPDGDRIFVTYKAVGSFGGQGGKGAYAIVGGTGKCAGMTGSGEFVRTSGRQPAAKQSFQGTHKAKGTYKIP